MASGGTFQTLFVLSLLSLSSACASFDGQAAPVLNTAAVAQVANAYPPATALADFYAETDATAQRAYRDKVVGAYLAAADLRYLEFRRNLSRESKGANLALNLAVLGLTGGASLASERTANALSAGAASLVGARASFSKELWFDKTLPALFAAMDARRTEVRGQILTRMQSSPQAYSLAEAFADIARYQEAATLDAAIQSVTADANARAVEADARYANVVLTYSGPPPADAAQKRADLKSRIETAAQTPGLLDKIADAVNVTKSADSQATLRALLAKMLDPATDLADFNAKVTAAIGSN